MTHFSQGTPISILGLVSTDLLLGQLKSKGGTYLGGIEGPNPGLLKLGVFIFSRVEGICSRFSVLVFLLFLYWRVTIGAGGNELRCPGSLQPN